MLHDFRTAPIDDKLKALFALIEKSNTRSTSIGQADIDAVKEAGWTDEAIYDAVTVHALFRFYNAWIDITGVHDMPAAAYAMSGKRLAETGYVPGGAKPDGK